jgi:hypothetical protein
LYKCKKTALALRTPGLLTVSMLARRETTRSSARSKYCTANIVGVFLAVTVLVCFHQWLQLPVFITLQPTESARQTLGKDAPCLSPEWPTYAVHPAIFIVGFGKTGSTSIHALLTQHPNITPAKRKELNFFPATGIANPMSVYATYFPNRTTNKPDAISIDASVTYIAEPRARDSLRHAFPCGKIIFLMRDPTVRWWSRYNHIQRGCQAWKKGNKGCEPSALKEFIAEALNETRQAMEYAGFTKELQKAGASFFSVRRHKRRQDLPVEQIFTKGMYYSHIMDWLEVWPRSQVLLVNTEGYFDPATLNDRMRVMTDFVGLKPHNFKPIPPKLPGANRHHVSPGDYGALPEPYESQIRAFFAPDLKLLKEHFGISFNASASGEAG